jgi:hypothetical protein
MMPEPTEATAEARAEHLRSEIRRCHAAIEGGDSDSWWREDLGRLEHELRLLEEGEAAREPEAGKLREALERITRLSGASFPCDRDWANEAKNIARTALSRNQGR